MRSLLPPLIVDTGATSHYVNADFLPYLINVSQASHGDNVNLPDGRSIPITQFGYLPFPEALSMQGRKVSVVPQLRHSLLSVSQLCQHGCQALFSTASVSITLDNKEIFNVTPSPSYPHLWFASFHQPPSVNVLIHHDNNADLVAFYHAAMGSPAVITFEQAVSRGFLTLPELTAVKIRQNKPTPMATAQGHLHAQRQGLRSTQAPTISPEKNESTDDYFPPLPLVPTSNIQFTIKPARDYTYRMHADTMGRFPVPSMHGANYLLLFFHEDCNYIHVEAMPSRSSAHFIAAFRRAIQLFTKTGFKPRMQRLDNEISAELLSVLQDEFNITCELAPPHNHRTLRVERAIQTFKNHFISTLCTCDPSFPLYLWEDLLPQSLLTLNLMRGSNITPTISAYEQLRVCPSPHPRPLAYLLFFLFHLSFCHCILYFRKPKGKHPFPLTTC